MRDAKDLEKKLTCMDVNHINYDSHHIHEGWFKG